MGLFDGIGKFLGIAPEASTRNFGNEIDESVISLAGVRPKILEYDQRDRPQFNAFEVDALTQLLHGGEHGGGLISLLAGAGDASRQAEIQSLQNLAPGANNALRALSPDSQGILDTLISQTNESLSRDGLSALDRQRIQEGVRSSQAVRGGGYGPNDTTEEAVALLVNDEAAQMRRRQEARDVLGSVNAYRNAPLLALLQGASNYDAGPLMSLATGINANSTLPLNPYANKDVADFNANAINAANIAGANAAAGIVGQTIGGVFDVRAAKETAKAQGGSNLFSNLFTR